MKDLVSLPARKGEAVLVVVETPAGSRVKLKLDPDFGHVALSRPLPLGLHYPYDWGFIPSTRAEDGDPLDAMLIGRGPSVAGTVVGARLLGVLEVAPLSGGGEPGPADVLALPERLRMELEDFFVWSTRWEKKELRFLGWKGIHEAETLLGKAERAARR